MDVHANISFGGHRRLARVQTHTDTNGGPFGPGVSREGTLNIRRSRESIYSTNKRHEESVPLCVNLMPVPPVKGCTQQLSVLFQQIGVAVAQLLEQARGSFNISEEQCNRSRREVMHG